MTVPGSSPRMRGTRGLDETAEILKGIIPAYAGNTRLSSRKGYPFGDHPRVCGEHASLLIAVSAGAGSSPRMRGTRLQRVFHAGTDGIIPAYAGNTLRDYSNFVVSKFMSFVFHLV